MFAMFGTTILVSLLTGLSVQVTLIGVGIGTVIFHFFAKGHVPVFLGSSFAFLVDATGTINKTCISGRFDAPLMYGCSYPGA